MQKEVLIGLLAVIIYPTVLLSNYYCYHHFPRERWPMVLLATLTWWGPIAGLGWLLWNIPAWFLGAQLLCLVSAFFATMTLKFVWYRQAAFKANDFQVVLWQREMLNVGYSLDQQAEHIQQALRDKHEIEKFLRKAQERQITLNTAIRQTDLYRQICQQILDDLAQNITSCYLSKPGEQEQKAGGADAREEESL